MSNVQQYNPFFEVVREPMFTEFNGKKIKASKDALINPELNVIVGEVGRNYKVVTNNEVANVFDEAFKGINVESVKDHLNGTTGKWVREIILNDDDYIFKIGDNKDQCKVKVDIFNGYTGKKSVGFNVSAYRLVCSNGLMGWKNQLSVSIPHVRDGIVETIRNEFHNKIDVLWNKVQIWETWSDEHFGKDDFKLFINTRDHLSDKMKDKFIGMYEPIMNKYNESETRWGAYNVLTAMASHHVEAQKGSHLFSNAYKRIEKLISEFESFLPEEHKKEDSALVVA